MDDAAFDKELERRLTQHAMFHLGQLSMTGGSIVSPRSKNAETLALSLGNSETLLLRGEKAGPLLNRLAEEIVNIELDDMAAPEVH